MIGGCFYFPDSVPFSNDKTTSQATTVHLLTLQPCLVSAQTRKALAMRKLQISVLG